MRLFDVLPKELFSLLSSPNQQIYVDALFVLYELYIDRFQILEDDFAAALMNRLERQLMLQDFEGVGILEEEFNHISGRARFLIRKLKERK